MLARIQSSALARQAYRDVHVQTATSGQILLRLYEGAIRFTRRARDGIEANDPAEKGVYIGKSMAIISELSAALDHTVAPELTNNLERLYQFMLDQLSVANMTMETAPLDVVLEHLTTLHGG
jgi:flagellar protein FliS